MAKAALLDADARFQAKTEKRRLVVAVIGKHPNDRPYLRIGDENNGYLDSLDVPEMRRLAAAIREALGE